VTPPTVQILLDLVSIRFHSPRIGKGEDERDRRPMYRTLTGGVKTIRFGVGLYPGNPFQYRLGATRGGCVLGQALRDGCIW
jgi:hypothetical protein